MDEQELARRFERNRPRLRGVAYRMLGSSGEADDAVQEAWLRLSRHGGGVENLDGWLTTVVSRVCLDMLRGRTRRPEPVGALPEPVPAGADEPGDPERQALLADSLGPALLVVLDTLTPAERLAFVLHDLFGVPYEEIAPIVGRTPAAARQLASRGRRRVRGAASGRDTDHGRQRAVVEAFLAASRGDDLAALLAVLDPDVVLRADSPPTELHGRAAVAAQAARYSAVAPYSRVALVGGAVGAVTVRDGRLLAVLAFTVRDGLVAALDIVADPVRLAELDLG